MMPDKLADHYSLSGEEAYTWLTGEYDFSMTGANSLIFLAAAFGEVRIPFRGTALAVGYAEGYYSVTFARPREFEKADGVSSRPTVQDGDEAFLSWWEAADFGSSMEPVAGVIFEAGWKARNSWTGGLS